MHLDDGLLGAMGAAAPETVLVDDSLADGWSGRDPATVCPRRANTLPVMCIATKKRLWKQSTGAVKS